MHTATCNHARAQVGKLLGEAWKALDAEGRVQYEAQAAQDKERYAEAMRQYKASGGGDVAEDGDGGGADEGGDDDGGAEEGGAEDGDAGDAQE